jgi:hypothetical protein
VRLDAGGTDLIGAHAPTVGHPPSMRVSVSNVRVR